MNIALQNEVKRLIGIARVHAVNALARPVDQREAYLARYRGVWNFYAAAFTGSDAERECFTDALDRATRNLMAEIESNAAVLCPAVVGQWLAPTIAADAPAATEPQYRPGEVITLDELRPILREIIGR